jgi:hypothetical protein
MTEYLVLRRHEGHERGGGPRTVPPSPWICAGRRGSSGATCHHAMALRWEEGFTSLDLWESATVATLPALGRPPPPASHAPPRRHGPEWKVVRHEERGDLASLDSRDAQRRRPRLRRAMLRRSLPSAERRERRKEKLGDGEKKTGRDAVVRVTR